MAVPPMVTGRRFEIARAIDVASGEGKTDSRGNFLARAGGMGKFPRQLASSRPNVARVCRCALAPRLLPEHVAAGRYR